MKIRLIIYGCVLLTLLSCHPKKNVDCQIVDPTLIATLYAQRAAEFDALCFQAYNSAQMRLEEQLKEPHSKPLAVVVDIDETILDNYPWQAKVIQADTAFPAFWDEWEKLGQAEVIPGSLEFLNFAAENDVKVFYISNRMQENIASTMRNLSEKGFPNVEEKFMMFKTKESGSAKQMRRDAVSKDYDIVLLCGDNLADFAEIFESENESVRDEAVLEYRSEFGNRWIVLPNPVYGVWLNAIMALQPDTIEANTFLKGELKAF